MATLFSWLFKRRARSCANTKLDEAAAHSNLSVIMHQATTSGLHFAVADNCQVQEKVSAQTKSDCLSVVGNKNTSP